MQNPGLLDDTVALEMVAFSVQSIISRKVNNEAIYALCKLSAKHNYGDLEISIVLLVMTTSIDEVNGSSILQCMFVHFLSR